MAEVVQTKKRNPVYDCAKGLGILLVVMGHCYFFGYQFFTRFHVLFFFVFAGLMLKSDSFINYKSLWQNICKFWKRYAVPYIMCNSIFLIFYNLFVKYHLVTHDIRLSESAVYINFNIFLAKLIKIFTLSTSSEQLCGATWFLRSLFLGLLAVAILLYVTQQINKHVIYLIFSLFLIAITLIFNNRFLFLFSQSVLCIIIGDYLKKYIEKIVSNFYIYLFCGTFAMLLLIVFLIKIQIVSVVLCAIFGFVFMMQSSLFFEKYLKKIYNLLVYFGQNTLPILCVHLLFFKLITYLYVLITHSDIMALGTFPSIQSINHPLILSVAYTCTGIIFPIMFFEIYKFFKKNTIAMVRRV